MSQHTNNPDCSVTLVKLVGYNGDDHFLLLMLKGVGGLADPLPYHFPQAIRSAMAAYGNQSGPVAVFVCIVCQILVGFSALSCCLLDLRLSFLACLRCSSCLALLLPPRSKTGVSGLSPLFKLFGSPAASSI